MSETIRIRTTPGGEDKYITTVIQQEFDFIEILSLKISQEDTYRKFCSDYGVVCGRITCNNGLGLPNVKVSIFLPLDEVDKNNSLIKGLYPYEIVTDKNSNGLRYNLLPKDGNPTNECSTPIGSFPSKREVLDNDTLLDIYCKYYKFTTTTNNSGDYLIFGVPLGTQIIHIDGDISDIGIFSQRPYDFISQGTPAKLFQSPTKFKGDKNLDKLIQVKTLNSSIEVQPFWGDPENCEISINRLDLDLNLSITPSAIFMGSIFGDQDKHSINKNCRPRKKLGELCEQITGPGSIDMIRKTLDGQIEEFSVDGGRVIDDDGTWAYQIPMNLDFMVTDEFGNLIPSQDPNKGIPTRASVRFSIGMDETGGDGRLRTRAKYLVPNNPNNTTEIDYEFGQNTKDTSFRDFHWNKIYSVSNFIPRYQKKFNVNPPGKVRDFTGIKDVDACAGDKTPFPYNRVNTELNPIFFVICLIIKIMVLLITVINLTLIPLIDIAISGINLLIGGIVLVINKIIDGIDSLGLKINEIPFTPIALIPCISIECNNNFYAPGCLANISLNVTPQPVLTDGLDDCIAFEMAKALNVFQLDFYNDWINGALFGFLLKYKKKKKHTERFCEYDCSTDFPGGVDSKNKCHNNLLLDSCYNSGVTNLITNEKSINSQDSTQEILIREGLIKKVGNNLFYAASAHELTPNSDIKLFATEIISLGSIFDCDWQGIPKIQSYLLPTTYKIPPDTEEMDDTESFIETTGMIDTLSKEHTGGLFFSINCLGVHTDYKQCLNLRHICEIGVDLDEVKEDPITGQVIVSADGVIGINDIDDDKGKFIRDVFFGLNNTTNISNLTIPTNGFFTNFNIHDADIYNFADSIDNGVDYSTFRGYNSQDNFSQPKHSYFFYFGLLPGKTGLDKMNQRFFTHCNVITRDDILIQSTVIPVNSGPTGGLNFTFIGGTGPYSYSITALPPLSFTTVIGIANPTGTLNGLEEGTYVISATDSLGTPVSQTVVVSGPPALFSLVSVTKNASGTGVSDGEITISSVGGGVAPYNYQVTTHAGAIVSNGILTIPKIIGGLGVDDTNGYIVTITDSIGDSSITTGLLVTGPNVINLTSVNKNILCFGDSTGEINLKITGAQAPFNITTNGTNTGFVSGLINMTNLKADTYTTTITDSLGKTATLVNVLVEVNGEMKLQSATNPELAKQCDPAQYSIPFYIKLGVSAGPVDVEYSIDNSGFITVSMTFVNSTTPLILNITNSINSNIKIRFKNSDGCLSNEITIDVSSIVLPKASLQCKITTIKFGNSYQHNITGAGGISPYTGEQTIIDSNQIITATITDSVGCTATSIG